MKRRRPTGWIFAALVPLVAAADAPDGVPIRLPLTFIDSIPVTTLTVGDTKVRAIVDTTAGDADGELTLSKQAIESAGAIGRGRAVMRDARGQEFAPPRFRLPFVVLDGRRIENVNAVQALVHPPEAGPSPNVIGKHFLSRYFVVVDFAGASVSLWPQDTRNPQGVDCGRTRIPMLPTREDRFAVAEFATDAGKVRLALGTSASYSLLTEAAVERMKLTTDPPGPDRPPFYRTQKLSAPGRDLGPTEFAVLSMQLPPDIDGMLGRGFFDGHVVCLDYARREIRVG